MSKEDWIVVDPDGDAYGDPHPTRAYLKRLAGSELVMGASGIEGWKLLEKSGWRVIKMSEYLSEVTECDSHPT